MNLHAAIELLETGEYLATRGDLKITRSITDGKLFRFTGTDWPEQGWLFMDKILQPWVDIGETWEPTAEDWAANDWVVTTLPEP